ncbi:MAG TPA: fatty acid desaturase [Pyrinomonadaceae bacterium]
MQNVIAFTPSTKIHWNTIFFVAAFHIFAILALFNFSWTNLAVTVAIWWIAGSWGIGIGYHRLLTHRGFKAPRWLERFLATCGTLAVQSGPIAWVTTHRIHHAFTETEKDPHSPRNGTYWAHIGWIFRGTAQIQPQTAIRKYSPDLIRDPYLVFIDKYYWATTVVVAAILFAAGGFSMVLWAIFLRTVAGWHFTWLVNSATHMWGSRRFETRDDSRNNGLIAAVTFGEGWHNNHHAYPRSARHGLTWREFDPNWTQIRALERLGIIKNVYALDLDAEEAQVYMKAAA